MWKKLSDEIRFVITVVIVMVAGLLVLLVMNRTGKNTDDLILNEKPQKEKTVIVSDAEKSAILSSVPKKVIESVRETAKQDAISTAYLQLSRSPQGSQEYEELKHVIETAAKLKKHPGVKKVKDAPGAPLRYIDKSTPRDRLTDALYLYLVDAGIGIWPRFCVQTVGNRQLKLNGFKITADGKTYQFSSLGFNMEKSGANITEYYDDTVTPQIYTVIQALAKARKGSIAYMGADGGRTREISEDEKQGLSRMMDTYVSLGGNFDYLREQKTPATAGKKR
jgi:hypothetical protein